MYPSVEAAFWKFTTPLEGYIVSMYTDVLGLVTTGVGNLIDPLPLALDLPWYRHSDNDLATADQIAAEWHEVKDGRIGAYERPLRPLYLQGADIRALVDGRLQQNEIYLARRWANWTEWPADAQLGAHSCAWAAGAAWRAPKFDAAVGTMDFSVPAGPLGDASVNPAFRGEAWLRDAGNPGLRRRNVANKTLFQNAAQVVLAASARDVLHWPEVLDARP